MTAATANPVAVLLADLMRLGIVIEATGDRLRYRPRDRMTPDLADRLKAHKGDVMALLRHSNAEADPISADDNTPPLAIYTAQERDLLADAPDTLRATVDAIKVTFADMGGTTVVNVRTDPAWARRQAAGLIRDSRLAGNKGKAVALRDAWHERLAICTIDDGLSQVEAESVALEEINQITKVIVDKAHL